MARRRPTATCARCGRHFHPCRYNAHHQSYCTDVPCVAERRRQRQREYYRKRYRHDEPFRQAEQTRCRKAMIRRRTPLPTVITPLEPAPSFFDFHLLATGLLAHIIGSNDPNQVHSTAQALQRRGQLLALAAPSARASP